MNLTHFVGTPNIQIMNLRDSQPSEPWDFRVDRGSSLGNPFPLHLHPDRESCIKAYYDHFIRTIIKKPDMISEIEQMLSAHQEHGIVRLYCWCVPKKCHAEIIREYLINCLV